jgi:hypothetical protein
MTPDRKIDPDKIHVLDIKTIKGNIDAALDIDINTIAGHSFAFESGTGLNVEENIIGVKLLVNIEAVDKTDIPLGIKGSYTHELVFRVENLSDFIESTGEGDEKSYDIDLLLGSTIISIAYSTIRGIIFNRTQGTSLGTVILPVVDPKILLGFNKENQQLQLK